MGLRDLAAVLTGERSERAAPPPLFDLLTGRYAGGVSSSTAAVGYDEAQAHGAVYACVDLLVRLVAWQMPAYIGDQPARATVVADPHPEPQMLAEHWRAEMLQAAMLRGYAAGIVTEYEASGWPRKILPVHPDLISWYEVERGRWGWFCDGQQMELWQTARGPLWIAPAPRVTPGQPVGASVLRYAAQKIKLGLTATKFAGDYFNAGGVPVAHGKVLNYPDITEQQAEALKDRVLRATSSRRPLITGSNFELDTIQVTAEESQFLATMQANVADVCMFFGVPPESIGGSSGDSMCVDAETEMLTTRGWLRYDQIEVGDTCLTLNVETGLGEWQPVEAVYVFDGPHEVMRFENGTHSSVTTSNHRWPVLGRDAVDLTWRESRTVTGDDRVLAAAPVANLPTEPKWSDALVELVAWHYTEGYVAPSGGVTIAQSERVNPELCDRIRAALTVLHGPAAPGRVRSRPAWVEDRREVIKFRLNKLAAAVLHEVAPGKVPTVEFLSALTRSQLELFIETTISADGWVTNFGTPVLGQKDRRRVEAFQTACALAGKSGVVRQDSAGRWFMAVQRGNLRKPKGHVNYLEHVVIEGPVWCPTTPNRTWFARRNGTTYFTGNTYANVEGRNLALLTNTVGAWMAWLERLYTRMLPRPQSVTLDPESLLRTSVPTLYDTVQKGVGRGGTPSVLTQNEGRAMLGYGPVEGGDTLFVPATFLPPADVNEEMPSDGEPTATP